MEDNKPSEMVTVAWDTKVTKVPANVARGIDLHMWNPWGDMFDRHLHVNGQPVDYDKPLSLKNGDKLLSVPKGSYV